jgi:hypothetical protein
MWNSRRGRGCNLVTLCFFLVHFVYGRHVVAQLRYYATNWKAAGSIPNGVIRIFH